MVVVISTSSSRKVCCCGADCWTKVLAWLQIIGSAFASVALIVSLACMLIAGDKKVTETLHSVDIPRQYRDYGFAIIVAIVAVLLLHALCSFVMGIILLKGANERNPNYIVIWMAYTGTTMAIQVVIKMVTLDKSHLAIDWISIVITIAINTFVIWVVYTFWREVRGDLHVVKSSQGKSMDNKEYKV